jgi:hypothetical protein
MEVLIPKAISRRTAIHGLNAGSGGYRNRMSGGVAAVAIPVLRREELLVLQHSGKQSFLSTRLSVKPHSTEKPTDWAGPYRNAGRFTVKIGKLAKGMTEYAGHESGLAPRPIGGVTASTNAASSA